MHGHDHKKSWVRYNETRQGQFIDGGSPVELFEWEFKTLSKFKGAKDDNKAAVASHIVDVLSDNTLGVAMKVGADQRATQEGVDL